MDEWRKKTLHALEEQILQIDRMEQYPEVEVSLFCFEEYLMWLNKWNEEHGKPFFILNWDGKRKGRDKRLILDFTLPLLAMFGNVVTSPKRH